MTSGTPLFIDGQKKWEINPQQSNHLQTLILIVKKDRFFLNLVSNVVLKTLSQDVRLSSNAEPILIYKQLCSD